MCAAWRRCAALRPTSCSTHSAPHRPVCFSFSLSSLSIFLLSLSRSLSSLSSLSLSCLSSLSHWRSVSDISSETQRRWFVSAGTVTLYPGHSGPNYTHLQDHGKTQVLTFFCWRERDGRTLVSESDVTAIRSSNTLNQEFFTFDTMTVFYSLSTREINQDNSKRLFKFHLW